MWLEEFFSFSALVAVAVAAKHLAVLLDGAAAVAPGRDVVALHQLKVQLAAAQFATVPLLPTTLQLRNLPDFRSG